VTRWYKSFRSAIFIQQSCGANVLCFVLALHRVPDFYVFVSWDLNTQLNRWNKRLVRTQLITEDPPPKMHSRRLVVCVCVCVCIYVCVCVCACMCVIHRCDDGSKHSIYYPEIQVVLNKKIWRRFNPAGCEDSITLCYTICRSAVFKKSCGSDELFVLLMIPLNRVLHRLNIHSNRTQRTFDLNIWISRSISFPDRSIEWRRLHLLWENSFEILGTPVKTCLIGTVTWLL